MRVAFFGMQSEFSVRPLRALIDAGHDVRLIVRPIGALHTRRKRILVPGAPQPGWKTILGAPPRPDPFSVGAEHDIPCWAVGNASAPE